MSIESLPLKKKQKYISSIKLPKLESKLISAEHKLLRKYQTNKKNSANTNFGLVQMDPPEPLRLRRS